MLTGPLFMLQIYDRVLTSGSLQTLFALAMLVAVLYALYGFLEYIRSRIMVRFAGILEAKFGERAFDAVNFHAVKGNPEVRTTPLVDMNSIRQFLSGPGPFAFLDAPWTPIYLLVIYLLHPLLGLASAIAVAILVIIAVINNLLTQKTNKAAQAILASAHASSEESRRNAEVTTAMGMLSAMRLRWKQIQGKALSEQMISSDRSGLLTSISRTMRLMFQSAMLGLGAWLVIEQEISAGTMIAASIIMARALAPVEQMVAHWQGFLNFRQAWARLSHTLSMLPQEVQQIALPDPEGKIEVKGLNAAAPGTNRAILSGISFDLKKGEALGIVGPTGSGKTTLAKVLLGVWSKYIGTVRIDGAEISQYSEQQINRTIGYLPQAVELFDGTIAQNIARFLADADEGEVMAAAKKAAIHELVLKFPEGYQTRIGEHGAVLSAGQRQRIGLARALYGNPPVIVLDEPNSNLDAEGEAAVVHAVKTARDGGSTVIIIAHRPSALSVLDRIMVLKEGQMAALGPKDEILKDIIKQPVPIRPDQKRPVSITTRLEKAAQTWSY